MLERHVSRIARLVLAASLAVGGTAQAIRGRVMDASGQPDPSARLTLLIERPRLMPKARGGRPQPLVVAHAKTGASGRFAVPIDRMVPDLRHVLHIASERGVDRQLPPLTRPQTELDLGDIRLEVGWTMTGTVRTEQPEDRPIVGAEVAVFVESPTQLHLQLDGPGARWAGHRTTTDGHGRFAVKHLPAAARHVQITAVGHATITEVIESVRGGPEVIRPSKCDAPCRMRVVDSQGRRIAGAFVWLHASGRRLVTDRSGAVTLTGCPSTEASDLTVAAPGFVPHTGTVEGSVATVKLVAEPEVVVRFTGREGGRIDASGPVQCVRTHSHARLLRGGAAVPLVPLVPLNPPDQTLTAAGGIRVAGVVPDHPLRLQGNVTGSLVNTTPTLTPTSDRPTETTIEFIQPVHLRGRVLFEDRPVAGAYVRLLHPVGRGFRVVKDCRTRTNSHGWFELTRFAPAEYMISIHHSGFAQLEITETFAGDPTRTYRLKRGTKLTGIVARPGGQPVPRTMVLVKSLTDRRREFRAHTDSHGRFEVPALPATRYSVVVFNYRNRVEREFEHPAETPLRLELPK